MNDNTINTIKYISKKDLENLITNFLLFPKLKMINNDLKYLIISFLYENNYEMYKLNDSKVDNSTYLYKIKNGDKLELNLKNIKSYLSIPNFYSFDQSVHISLCIEKNIISLIKYIENDIESKIKCNFKQKNINDIKFYSSIINNKLSINMDSKELIKIKDDTKETVNQYNYEYIDSNKENTYVSIRDLVYNMLNFYQICVNLDCKIILDKIKVIKNTSYIIWKIIYVNELYIKKIEKKFNNEYLLYN